MNKKDIELTEYEFESIYGQVHEEPTGIRRLGVLLNVSGSLGIVSTALICWMIELSVQDGMFCFAAITSVSLTGIKLVDFAYLSAYRRYCNQKIMFKGVLSRVEKQLQELQRCNKT